LYVEGSGENEGENEGSKEGGSGRRRKEEESPS
jgi:hypothetical protein